MLLAPLLQHGSTYPQLTAQLTRSGAEPDLARKWVRTLLDQLAGLAMLETTGIVEQPAPLVTQRFQLGPLQFSVGYGTDELHRTIAPLFEHLEPSTRSPDISLQLREFGAGLVQLQEDRRPALLVPRGRAAVQLKGMMLQRLLASDRILGALHAGLLARSDQGLLLLGSPGAGKSTLALALMSRGFDYASDDVSLVGLAGSVTGVAFAPGLKKGSWPIADQLGAELTPPHLRPDGQEVRFARTPTVRTLASYPIGMILSLSRVARAVPRLEKMESHEALEALIQEGRSSSGICSAALMSALAKIVRGAHCYRLHYAEAPQAADLISNLVARD